MTTLHAQQPYTTTPTQHPAHQHPHAGTSAGEGQESEPEWTPDFTFSPSRPGQHESREWLPLASEGLTGPWVVGVMGGRVYDAEPGGG